MKPFHTIAVPHKDILEGRLTMDVFAADLWEVSQKRGPDEYKDSDTFFRKTYLTQGLDNLLGVVEKRLGGKGGDPVIQIQTPFGGGKTHALIAMYHKASQWKANKVVIVGTALSAKQTLWGLLEKQLTGKIAKLTGQVSPGRDAIKELLAMHQPVMILMDEVLEYATKAAGVKVGESTLAAQSMAFMQELTEAAGTLKKTCVLVTLPSSIMEHYDESAEKLYQQLQKVAGRVEKIYTPVQENEIARIIKTRLFSQLDDSAAKKVVSAFTQYVEKEEILPIGMQPSEYRDRFINSYPFMPEVIDVLYHRWGSFPTFQRTRGVLRLLSLVIYSLKNKGRSYISLADFDLGNQEIRQELLKHIGSEYNSIIAADITDADAGAKKVDTSLGKAYRGLNLGSRVATTIFLHSFSGGHEVGAMLSEIKRCATTTENPAPVVAEAVRESVDLSTGKLFYLYQKGDKYFFTTQPNLRRVVLNTMENIRPDELVESEKELLREKLGAKKLKVFVWEEESVNIPDSEELKLIILKKKDEGVMQSIVKTKGLTPRVCPNTLFFLYPLKSERQAFMNALKRVIAYEYIGKDTTLKLPEEQKKEVKKELKKSTEGLSESLRRLYRAVAIPVKDGFKEVDLGVPTYGEDKYLDQEVYDKLHADGEILETIAAVVVKEKYLVGKDYVLTEQIHQSSLRTPGEPRPTNQSVFQRGIGEGVQMGLFGLGELEDDKPVCRFFKEQSSVALSGQEIVISETICREQKKERAGVEAPVGPVGGDSEEPKEPEKPTGEPPFESDGIKKSVKLSFTVPKGKVAGIMGVMNFLQSKFENLEIDIDATNGAISKQDYEDKIEEAFRQLDIDIEDH